MTPDELMAAALSWQGRSQGDVEPSAWAAGARAVVAWVGSLPIVRDRPDPSAPWPDDAKLGSVMLLARTMRRQDSPLATFSIGEDMSPSFVARHDPDVTRYLRLDAPAVG